MFIKFGDVSVKLLAIFGLQFPKTEDSIILVG